jgi:hypothetical protein
MHLTPAALDAAIQLFDGRGNMLATRATGTAEGQLRWVNCRETGGEAGIRTLGRSLSPYNGLANRRLRPLGHLTAARKLSINDIGTYRERSCPHHCP